MLHHHYIIAKLTIFHLIQHMNAVAFSEGHLTGPLGFIAVKSFVLGDFYLTDSES